MEKIVSEQNKLIKKLKALRIKKFRDKYQQFVIEGVRFCQEAINNNISIEALLVSEKVLDSPSVKEILNLYHGKYYIVDSNIIDKSLSTVNPQGIAAIVKKPVWNIHDTLKGNFIVIIDGVQDPGNLGTIIRTALGVEADGVMCLKGTVDFLNDKTLRSTMGAIFHIPVFTIEKEALVDLLNKYNFKTVIADVNTSQNYYSLKYPDKVALVLGSEAFGPQSIKEGDLSIRIPLNPKVESLNVAVAGGVIMYEIYKQRRG